MSTLHILRSEPDEQVRELIRAVTGSDDGQVALHRGDIDYDGLVDALFSHDRIISWW